MEDKSHKRMLDMLPEHSNTTKTTGSFPSSKNIFEDLMKKNDGYFFETNEKNGIRHGTSIGVSPY